MTGQTEDQLQHEHFLVAPFLVTLFNRVLQCKPDSNTGCCVHYGKSVDFSCVTDCLLRMS